MLHAIVFDFDGVLVNSEPLHFRALRQVAQGFGWTFEYDRYLRTYIGYDDRDALRVMLAEAALAKAGQPVPADVHPEAWQGDPAELAELVRVKGQMFADIVAAGVETIPGVQELVHAAYGQIPLAIASGATRQDIDLILGGTGLAGKFEVIVTADMVRRSKPDPETYAAAVAVLAQRRPELGLRPAACLAIEDTPAGIASARGAGLQVLGLTTNCAALHLHRAHRVVDTLEGITLTKLQAWFGA